MYKIGLILVVLTTVSCRSVDERIVGGCKAEDGEFPYQVSIKYRNEHDCGGAILDEYWILTAAHCLRNRLVSKLTVDVGTINIDGGGDTYNVSKIIPHRLFSSFLRNDDIGLLKVATPIKFGPKVQPIRLPVTDVGSGEILTLTGWGQLGVHEERATELQKIQLKSISNFRCSIKMNPNFVYTTNICTLNKRGQGACYGDSGGPLVMDGEIKGIVSWSRPCARGKPDVFTRVYNYLPWIEMNKSEKL